MVPRYPRNDDRGGEGFQRRVLNEIEKMASRDKSEWHRGRLFFFDSWVDFIKSSCVVFGQAAMPPPPRVT